MSKYYIIFILRVPKDEAMKERWVSAIRRPAFTPTKNSYVCSQHFVQNDYYTNIMGNQSLKPNAVPSLFMWNNNIAVPVALLCSVPNSDQQMTLPIDPPLPVEVTIKEEKVEEEEEVTSSTVSIDIPPRRREPHYFGDFVEQDLEWPVRRKKFWQVSHTVVEKQKQKSKYYEMANRRLSKKIETLENLIKNMQQTKQNSDKDSGIIV